MSGFSRGSKTSKVLTRKKVKSEADMALNKADLRERESIQDRLR